MVAKRVLDKIQAHRPCPGDQQSEFLKEGNLIRPRNLHYKKELRWIKKMWYIYIIEVLLQIIKRNEIVPFVEVWMDLELYRVK